MHVVNQQDLPISRIARELVGEDYGDVGVSLILVDAPPGGGPPLHRHPYAEVFLVHEGQVTFRVGDEEREAHAGHIVVVPPQAPHGFTNTGAAHLRMTDIHASPKFVTEWL